MTVSPIGVNVADTSTGTKPVTHTALVEVNKASTHDNTTPSTVQRGNNNNPVPIRIITKKLTARINDGLVLRPSKRTSPFDKLRKENNFLYLIEVDGGINQETSLLCKEAGVDILVAGSYIYNKDNRKMAIESLIG